MHGSGEDALRFFGLERTGPARWRMGVVERLVSGLGTLFGGAALGACIEVLERETGRRLVWATGQFLSYARPPSTMEILAVEAARGHRISQARAVGTVDGEEILTVNAALGHRPVDLAGSWAVMPHVPRPEDCPQRRLDDRHRGTLMAHTEMRLADARPLEELPGPPGDGRCALWLRFPDLEVSAAALAIVGDFVPFGIGQALGERAGGNSLDNTLRVAHRVPTAWVLADVRVHAVVDGFGHGLVHLWSDDGTLLGTASQSTIVRRWADQPADPAGDAPRSGGSP